MGARLPKESKLSKYKLKYEVHTKQKSVSEKYKEEQKPKKRVDIKKILLNNISKVKTTYKNVVKKVIHHNKKTKKMTKIEREMMTNERKNAILGICNLFVVVSIAYSSAITFIGVDSLVSKIALIPQALFALIILVKSFSKLYK